MKHKPKKDKTVRWVIRSPKNKWLVILDGPPTKAIKDCYSGVHGKVNVLKLSY